MATTPKKKTTRAKKTSTPSAKKVKNSPAPSLLENPRFVHAVAYVPYFIGAVAMYFLAKSSKVAAKHHINYSALMAVGAVILMIVLNPFFSGVVNLIYLWISAYFAFRAYNGEVVQVEILDTIEEKISETVKK